MSSSIVTRFAPSPTGYLHVGGARTALFNWLLARHAGGKFLLRIEDTDLARSTQASVDAVVEDLRWLNLNWDNAELVFQSKRLPAYNRIIDDLMSRNMAYFAYESSQELTAMRTLAEREKRSFIYRRRNYSADELKRFADENRTPVVRFATPVQEYRFHDAVLDKEIVVAPEQVQDFVIRKTDGMPTYHFAVVVDDSQMGITHILRGQEHTLNTINHIALQEALGYERPVYGHLPVILNTDGSKMGKRDRDKMVRHHANLWLKQTKGSPTDLASAIKLDAQRVISWLGSDKIQLDLDEQLTVMGVVGLHESNLPEILVHDFRKNGYLPEVLLNFLALLGWSPGGDIERMAVDDMVQRFSLSGVGSSNSKFSRDKLLAFNTEACAAADSDRLLAAFQDYLAANPASPLNAASDDQLRKLLEMKKGMRRLREVDEAAGFLFIPDDQIQYSPDAVEKVLRKQEAQGFSALEDLRPLLQNTPDWSAAALEETVKHYCDAKGLALGKVAQPLRVAVTGTTVSPPIFESLVFLGRDSTLARIDRCLALR